MNDSASPEARRARRPRRTTALLSGAVAALLIGLTACGSGGSDESADKPAEGKAGGAFPAKVATKFGEIAIDEAPKRIVALGWGDAETALALGAQPVGASDWLPFGGEGVGPWAKGMYDEKPELIGTMEPEFEKIAALEPDLILDTKSSGDQTRYDTLSKIAPTVGVPKGGDMYMTSWEKQTEMVAGALGKKDEGAELIAETGKKFQAAAEKHPEFKGKSITIGSRTSEGFGAYVGGTGRVDFVKRLGFVNNPEIEKLAGDSFSVSVSKEKLDLLDADLTVMAPIGISAEEISGDPLYKAVPSVKDGRSIVFDDQDISQAFATDSVLSVGYALEKVVPLFSEKLK
ncbi:iron-siderophore ABC transporter substrate-binding protein [Streptomyces sp. SID8014]|uniref:iron-siderophore ABC transporter substrate-binding protein n=1 Tax=Streptomyces sp. SID8014 TaxID=2706097 RepID=UPI0013BE7721|nr:iron-siderophore ABC transporter substrate-binding protein [Streptomyces sp. SID8014]NEC11121.1 iron-siderophore ABC transporter substrate-binding protein [Streptomyces sp. SID8014]